MFLGVRLKNETFDGVSTSSSMDREEEEEDQMRGQEVNDKELVCAHCLLFSVCVLVSGYTCASVCPSAHLHNVFECISLPLCMCMCVYACVGLCLVDPGLRACHIPLMETMATTHPATPKTVADTATSR